MTSTYLLKIYIYSLFPPSTSLSLLAVGINGTLQALEDFAVGRVHSGAVPDLILCLCTQTLNLCLRAEETLNFNVLFFCG